MKISGDLEGQSSRSRWPALGTLQTDPMCMHQGPSHNATHARQSLPLFCLALLHLGSNPLGRASQHSSLPFQTYVPKIPQISSFKGLTDSGHSLLFSFSFATLGKALRARGD